ncbi:MAG: peptidoglycan-binding protein [Acidobacteria bacterium]|nr:peptidoglycan-binding protein [Acidobacteriota bacterium]
MLGFNELVIRRVGSVAIMAMALLVLSGSSALAQRAREYGEMVDYPLVFPVDGPVSLSDTFYGTRSTGDHHAQDLMAPKMTPVLAVASGTVHYVNWSRDPESLNPHRCCSIAIRHDDGWESWYLHLNNDTPGTDDGQVWGIVEGVVPGGRVEAGQHIGWVGDSGNAESTPPHLHFELFDAGGVIVNPFNALRAACGGRCRVTGGAIAAPTSATTAAGPNDTLRFGSRGNVVFETQLTLGSLGFDPGPVDGIFGRMTVTAVAAFQSANGLAVDGKVGPVTRRALVSASPSSELVVSAPSSVVDFGIRDPIVVELQGMLARVGHRQGGTDGAFGPLTFGAVRDFQKVAGLPDTGTVDQGTWDALVFAAAGSTVDLSAIVVSYATRGPDVRDLQTMLEALGHDPGPIDWTFGLMTRRAVVSFQAMVNLAASGIVDHATWNALEAAYRG